MDSSFDVIIGILSAVLGIAIWLFVILAVVRAVKKSSRGTGTLQKNTAAGNRRTMPPQAAPRPVKNAGSRQKAKAAKKLYKQLEGQDEVIHDSQDDWLSRQLKEERRALRETSAMFDLKMSHMDHCDAGNLRQSHAENCDAEQVRKQSRK